jgi:hypothetical protein
MKQQTAPIEQYWPATKAARILGMSVPMLRQLAEDGRIDCYATPGGKMRYNVSAFLSIAKAATRSRLNRKAAARKAKPGKSAEPTLPGIAEADKANQVTA